MPLKDDADFVERSLLLNRAVLSQFSVVSAFVVGGSMGYSRSRRQQGTRHLRMAQGKVVMDDHKTQLVEILLSIRRLIAGVLVEYECPALKRRG